MGEGVRLITHQDATLLSPETVILDGARYDPHQVNREKNTRKLKLCEMIDNGVINHRKKVPKNPMFQNPLFGGRKPPILVLLQLHVVSTYDSRDSNGQICKSARSTCKCNFLVPMDSLDHYF